MKVFNNTNIPLLSKALDTYSLRQQVISSNIANINTLGYQAKQVRFEEELQNAVQGDKRSAGITHPRHIPINANATTGIQPRIVDSQDGNREEDDPLASGVNNVDIDQEMADMAENQIRYRFTARMISGAFKGLQKSIRGHS